MKIVNLIIQLIFLLLVGNKIFSQNNFEPGYTIDLKGDTCRGLINYQTKSLNSKICEFRKTLDSETTTYFPEDIRIFMVDNKVYASKTIKITDSTSTVFLEYLVDGIVDLYYYKDNAQSFYCIEKDTVLYKLTNKQYEIIKNEKTYTTYSNEYKGVLSYLFADSPGLATEVYKTGYDERSLIHLTTDYHISVCNEYSCIDYTRKTSLQFYIEPTIAYVFSRLNVKTAPECAKDQEVLMGINLRFVPGVISDRWNFLLGFQYYSPNFEGIFNPTEDWINGMLRLTMSYSAIRIPLYSEYTFFRKGICPVISGGIVNTILSKTYFKEEVYNGHEWIQYPFEEIELKKYYMGLTLGAGAKYLIKKRLYVIAKCDYEFIFPTLHNTQIQDLLSVESIFNSITLGIRLK